MSTNLNLLWQDLLTTAILGTDRHSTQVSAVGSLVSDIMAELDQSDPSQYLLSAAALVRSVQQAGRIPDRLINELEISSPPEDLPRCSAAAGARLTNMLEGINRELIPEWLLLASAARVRVPEEVLPDLFLWAEKNLEQMDLVMAVCGQRGRWLAERMSGLEHVKTAAVIGRLTDEQVENFWQTERKNARRMLLQQLRKADPNRGLALIQSTWKEDGADERKMFLGALIIGLNAGDEAFLESVLDDSSKEVRLSAADLLARLPSSALVKRQTERVRALLHYKPGGFLRKSQLEVDLPEKCAPGMIRDGVEAKRAGRDQGEKADWLYQMLAVVPPGVWSVEWGA